MWCFVGHYLSLSLLLFSPLYCLPFFDLRLLITPLISSDYPFGIFWLPPWYLLITPLVSSNLTWCHCHKNSTFDITRWVNFTKYLHFTKIYFYHLSPTRLLRTCQWITCLLCYKQQEMFTFCEHLSSHHLIDDVHVFSAFCEHLSSHLIDDVHVFLPFVSTWVHIILLMMSMYSYLLQALEFTSYWWCPCILTFCKHISSYWWCRYIFSLLWVLEFTSYWWCPCILTFCEHLSSHLIDDVHVFLPFVST